jgi:hypothetical protein
VRPGTCHIHHLTSLVQLHNKHTPKTQKHSRAVMSQHAWDASCVLHRLTLVRDGGAGYTQTSAYQSISVMLPIRSASGRMAVDLQHAMRLLRWLSTRMSVRLPTCTSHFLPTWPALKRTTMSCLRRTPPPPSVVCHATLLLLLLRRAADGAENTHRSMYSPYALVVMCPALPTNAQLRILHSATQRC